MMRNRIFIALAAVAAVVLTGLLMGVWLSSNAPVERAAEAPEPSMARPGEAPIAAVDAQAYVPEPPQPRVDGTHGVPARRLAASDAVPMVSAMEETPPDVVVSNVAPDLEELREQHEQEGVAPTIVTQPSPSSQVVTVDLPGTAQAGVTGGPGGAQLPLTQQNDAADPNVAGWVRALRADLAQCASQGALSRVFCSEQARWRHCGPNNGWGKAPECPGTGNN